MKRVRKKRNIYFNLIPIKKKTFKNIPILLEVSSVFSELSSSEAILIHIGTSTISSKMKNSKRRT